MSSRNAFLSYGLEVKNIINMARFWQGPKYILEPHVASTKWKLEDYLGSFYRETIPLRNILLSWPFSIPKALPLPTSS